MEMIKEVKKNSKRKKIEKFKKEKANDSTANDDTVEAAPSDLDVSSPSDGTVGSQRDKEGYMEPNFSLQTELLAFDSAPVTATPSGKDSQSMLMADIKRPSNEVEDGAAVCNVPAENAVETRKTQEALAEISGKATSNTEVALTIEAKMDSLSKNQNHAVSTSSTLVINTLTEHAEATSVSSICESLVTPAAESSTENVIPAKSAYSSIHKPLEGVHRAIMESPRQIVRWKQPLETIDPSSLSLTSPKSLSSDDNDIVPVTTHSIQKISGFNLPYIRPFITQFTTTTSFDEVTKADVNDKVPLKVPWKVLEEKFDLVLDDSEDEAWTSIEYYKMILREDLLPTRNSRTAAKNLPMQSTSETRSDVSVNISDSMKNLYSGTSLLHRSNHTECNCCRHHASHAHSYCSRHSGHFNCDENKEPKEYCPRANSYGLCPRHYKQLKKKGLLQGQPYVVQVSRENKSQDSWISKTKNILSRARNKFRFTFQLKSPKKAQPLGSNSEVNQAVEPKSEGRDESGKAKENGDEASNQISPSALVEGSFNGIDSLLFPS